MIENMGSILEEVKKKIAIFYATVCWRKGLPPDGLNTAAAA